MNLFLLLNRFYFFDYLDKYSMILLTEKQKEKVYLLQNQFSVVHQEIEVIKNEMDRLNRESEILVEKLTLLREEEVKLMSGLENEYGAGKLDPFSMTYQK